MGKGGKKKKIKCTTKNVGKMNPSARHLFLPRFLGLLHIPVDLSAAYRHRS
jgi:hypothetical protein